MVRLTEKQPTNYTSLKVLLGTEYFYNLIFNSEVKKVAKESLKIWTVFLFGCFAYGLAELIARGHTHISMGLLGGVCMIFISILNDRRGLGFGLLPACIISALFITVMEYATGEILNIWLRLGVWDYSEMPMNFRGQICLPFSLLWIFMSGLGFALDNFIRINIFGDIGIPLFNRKIGSKA